MIALNTMLCTSNASNMINNNNNNNNNNNINNIVINNINRDMIASVGLPLRNDCS